MQNADIQQEVKAAGLCLWQVAEKYGCNDGNFSRLLRHELPAEKKAHIRSIIAKLKEEQA